MKKVFPGPGPTSLYVELGAGSVTVQAGEVTETTVEVVGEAADEVVVEQRADRIVVIAPRRPAGFLSRSAEVTVRVSLPHDSRLAARVGSADLHASGRLGETRLNTGSGRVEVDEVAGDLLVESGSGDVAVGEVHGDLRVRSGSGGVRVGRLGSAGSVATGSGDVHVTEAARPLQAKSGSGELRVDTAYQDLSLGSASGDLVVGCMHRGKLRATNVSGDIRIGVPSGVPVWTDLSTLTGTVCSTLQGVGRPARGQDHLELRARTVSGDIHLEQR